jgi:hypothetical protein
VLPSTELAAMGVEVAVQNGRLTLRSLENTQQ